MILYNYPKRIKKVLADDDTNELELFQEAAGKADP
jgi:hypothetical protein